MRLEDMRLFGSVAEAKSFTAAARRLGIPKQTLSRRVLELERSLGVQLLHRTTRRLHLTDVGAAYAERCAEVVRLAEEANQAVTDAHEVPRGVLRVTADPLFGEAFVTPLVVTYADRFPEVSVEVTLTRRRVELLEEGFDVAFRVGGVQDGALTATSLGPARVRYCASTAYVERCGAPESPEDLARHECIVLASDGSPPRWPFRSKKGPVLLGVSGRLRFNSFAMTRAAAIAGLGIAVFPEFACADDIREGRLVPLLEDWLVDVGSVWIVHATHRYLTARVRTFVELSVESLGREPPWVAPARDARERSTGRRR